MYSMILYFAQGMMCEICRRAFVAGDLSCSQFNLLNNVLRDGEQ